MIAKQHKPQAVVEYAGKAAIFIVYTLSTAEDAVDTVRDYCANSVALARSVSHRYPESLLSCTIGFSENAWEQLFGRPRPNKLHTLPEFNGAKHQAPSTPGDILLHIRGEQMDVCFELAMQIQKQLGNAVTLIDETHGFRYFDARSMIGFVDGTENPAADDAVDAAAVGDEDPQFAGGTYIIVQKYLHDMDAWNQLSTEEQERVIGRTKVDNIEMPDDIKPANSHIALNVIEDETGEELEIVRDNMPFGHPGSDEFGTYFIGYARDPLITETMLNNMFIGSPPGNYDRLLDFSTAITGTLFFAPCADQLEQLAEGNPSIDAPPLPAETSITQTPSEIRATEGSLNIGSLKDLPPDA